MYKIYKHTTPDGRAYIGYTGEDKAYKRWCYGAGYINQPRFYEAIMMFGWNNIQHEILEEVETKEEAKKRERYYINLYQTYIDSNGFNTYTNNSRGGKKRWIRNLDTGELFRSCREAGETVDRTAAAISYACLNNKKCGGYFWQYENL